MLELVKLIQASLAIFGLFDLSVDARSGLLCDATCDGIQEWVTEIGEPYLSIEVIILCAGGHSDAHINMLIIVADREGCRSYGHSSPIQSHLEHPE